MEDDLKFLMDIRQSIFENKSDNWHEEYSLINTLIEEMEWQNLTSFEKNEYRKAAFSMSKKWSKESIFLDNTPPFKDISAYPDALILVYDLVSKLLEKILIQNNSIVIDRLKALLIIEQKFFDEKILPLRHIPIEMFRILYDEVNDPEIKNDLGMLIHAYEKMGDLWPQNPYKGKT